MTELTLGSTAALCNTLKEGGKTVEQESSSRS